MCVCDKHDLLDCHEITKFIYFQTRQPKVIKTMTKTPFGHFFNPYNMPCVNFLTYDTRRDQTFHLLGIQKSLNHPTTTLHGENY